MKALDIEAVQAFVLVADLRSFTRAAEALDGTQSAVSLQVKALEEERDTLLRTYHFNHLLLFKEARVSHYSDSNDT